MDLLPIISRVSIHLRTKPCAMIISHFCPCFLVNSIWVIWHSFFVVNANSAEMLPNVSKHSCFGRAQYAPYIDCNILWTCNGNLTEKRLTQHVQYWTVPISFNVNTWISEIITEQTKKHLGPELLFYILNLLYFNIIYYEHVERFIICQSREICSIAQLSKTQCPKSRFRIQSIELQWANINSGIEHRSFKKEEKKMLEIYYTRFV